MAADLAQVLLDLATIHQGGVPIIICGLLASLVAVLLNRGVVAMSTVEGGAMAARIARVVQNCVKTRA